ncbi:MAG: hypothetical protein AAF299_11060 [Pseudomonadota bacterium]
MNAERPKPKRKLNATEKRALRAEELRLFMKQVGRPAQKGIEPNDRNHDRTVAQKIKGMKPEVLDDLLRDGDDD